MAQFEDEVTRAMDRNGVSRESPMERLVRQNLYNIAAANYEDQSDRDRKIDQFISRQSDSRKRRRRTRSGRRT